MPTIIDSGTRKHIVNFQPIDLADLLNAWRDLFVDAGWTVIAHSDGTTVGSGDFAVDADMQKTNAWRHMRSPGGHDIAMQRPNYEYGLLIRYCDEPLSGGSPTDPPSSGEQINLTNNGDSFDSNFAMNPPGSGRWHMHCDTEPVNGVYAFSLIGRQSGGNAQARVFVDSLHTVFARDPIGDVVGDPDNAKWIANGSPSDTILSQRLWYRRGLLGEALRNNVQDYRLPNSQTLPDDALNPNRYSQLLQFTRAIASDSSTSGYQHWKGLCENIFIAPSSTLGNGDTLNLTTPGGALVRWGNYLWRWPHNVAPLV